MRKFEQVKQEFKAYKHDVELPTRADPRSAGYDFICPQRVELQPGEKITIPTDIKAIMESDEVLMLHVRSSIGIKKGIVLMNGTGVIDSSYYSNESNDGNIMFALKNTSNEVQVIEAGDRVMQGVFLKYLITDDDLPRNNVRTGGIGSSGK